MGAQLVYRPVCPPVPDPACRGGRAGRDGGDPAGQSGRRKKHPVRQPGDQRLAPALGRDGPDPGGRRDPGAGPPAGGPEERLHRSAEGVRSACGVRGILSRHRQGDHRPHAGRFGCGRGDDAPGAAPSAGVSPLRSECRTLPVSSRAGPGLSEGGGVRLQLRLSRRRGLRTAAPGGDGLRLLRFPVWFPGGGTFGNPRAVADARWGRAGGESWLGGRDRC